MIKIIRRQKGLTISAISKEVGISRELFGRIETNKANPKVNTLEDICDKLSIELRMLLK